MTRRSPKQPGFRTFYATDEVTVTDLWLIVGARRLPIRQLRNLQVSQAKTSRLPATVAFTATVFPLVSVFSGVRGVASWAAVVLITGLILAAAAVLGLRNDPLRILFADHAEIYHDPVYANSDERVFGQVTRAVQRASEFNRNRDRLTPNYRVSPYLPATPLVADAAPE
jgi:hypothetical protein